jgi:hypothetical protein
VEECGEGYELEVGLYSKDELRCVKMEGWE